MSDVNLGHSNVKGWSKAMNITQYHVDVKAIFSNMQVDIDIFDIRFDSDILIRSSLWYLDMVHLSMILVTFIFSFHLAVYLLQLVTDSLE